MKGKSPYVGKIENAGTQVVEAPFKTANPKSAAVKKGGDLRVKGGKK